MTRDELLKKCVDRGVADESSVGSVSHLFYVYLLSALQRGQRVEIPTFGTFGTRVVGVKRAKKMPFFDPDFELAEKVNERYRNLKYLVVGKYELVPAVEETEYKGRESPYDAAIDQLGKEMVIDTHHEISPEKYEELVQRLERPRPTKERRPMPKFNLKDEGVEVQVKETVPTPTPRLHETAAAGGGPGPLVQVLIAIVVLGLLTLGLHYFGVIRLWGPPAPPESTLAEPAPFEAPQEQQPPPVTEAPPPAAQVPTPVPVQPAPSTPVPVEKPKAAKPVGTGIYTVQVSSWVSSSKADQEAARLTEAGFAAFVEEGNVDGVQRHRVRVGRYDTRREAGAEALRLREMLENGAWVTRVGH